MRTTIDSYKARAGRLDLEGIDFGDFTDRPLAPDVLRSLRYMHDIEHHTVCYLRDLLLTPAHQDPEITAFLSCWAYEEMWHGEAIASVLEAHGEVAGAPRVAALRAWTPAPAGGDDAEHHRLGGVRGTGVRRSPHDLGGGERMDDPGRIRTPLRDGRTSDAARAAPQDHEAGGHTHRLLRLRGRSPAGRQPQSAEAHPLRAVALVAAGRLRRDAEEGGRLPRQLPLRRPKGREILERIDRRVDRLPGQRDLQLLQRAVARLGSG